jgi:hypothetical protein
MDYERMRRELEALNTALRLMGLDPRKLAESMQSGDAFWKTRTLMAVRAEFSREAAASAEPRIAESGLDACEAWFDGLKLAQADAER